MRLMLRNCDSPISIVGFSAFIDMGSPPPTPLPHGSRIPTPIHYPAPISACKSPREEPGSASNVKHVHNPSGVEPRSQLVRGRLPRHPRVPSHIYISGFYTFTWQGRILLTTSTALLHPPLSGQQRRNASILGRRGTRVLYSYKFLRWAGEGGLHTWDGTSIYRYTRNTTCVGSGDI